MLEAVKKNKIYIIVISSILIVIAIILICYYNIPRIEYKYSDEHEGYLVTEVFGKKKKYRIEDTYKGKPVVGVSTRAFFRHDNLEEVIFESPENITFIGKLAFSECPNLKKIDISHVEEIERNAFSYDYSLDNLTISAKNIGASAFYKCTSLKNVKLENTVKSIGSMTFSTTGLEEIDIPASVVFIGVDCFIYSDKLKEIRIYSKDLYDNDYIKSLDNVIKMA